MERCDNQNVCRQSVCRDFSRVWKPLLFHRMKSLILLSIYRKEIYSYLSMELKMDGLHFLFSKIKNFPKIGGADPHFFPPDFHRTEADVNWELTQNRGDPVILPETEL